MSAPPGNPFGKWSAYELRHMASHMRNRGRLADLKRIFTLAWFDPSRGISERDAFYDARLAIDDVGGFIADLVATRLAVARDNQLRLGRGAAATGIGQELRYALTEAALRSFAQNLPARVIAGLVEFGELSLGSAITVAMRGSDWTRKFDQISALVDVVKPAWLRDSTEHCALWAPCELNEGLTRAGRFGIPKLSDMLGMLF